MSEAVAGRGRLAALAATLSLAAALALGVAIGLAAFPAAAVAAPPTVYVTNNGGGNVSNVSQYGIGADGRLSPKGPATVAAGANPLGVAVAPDGRSAYVTNNGGGNVSQYGIGADGRLSPKSPATVAAGFGPIGVAVTPPEPSNEFSFGKVKKNKKRGTAKLTVIVPGPGGLELAKTKKVKGDEERTEAQGSVKLAVKSRGKAKRKLNRRGKAKVRAEVTYTPDGGQPNTDSKKVKLVKK